MGIHIFWDSRVPLGLAGPATEELSNVLKQRIYRIDNGTFPLEGYDPVRKQYDALKILKKMDLFRQFHPELFNVENWNAEQYWKYQTKEKFLLVTAGDLFGDMKDYVYGLAHQRWGVAVVSTTRLDNNFYGRSTVDYDDTRAIIKHLVTECAHEIAHLYGLEHCNLPQCIMYCPNNFDNLDYKNESFCRECDELLLKNIEREDMNGEI